MHPRIFFFAAALAFIVFSNPLAAHEPGHASYLGNSGVLVSGKDSKVMFDPFFHNDFGIYQLVPEVTREAMMEGKAPFDDIDAIVISHAHEDHFDVKDVKNYLIKHQQTHLIAPNQAIQLIRDQGIPSELETRLHAVTLSFEQAPTQLSVAELKIDAVRIPHAGWPSRKEVENLVFRVTLDDGATVMHMGDADPNDDHYLLFKSHWQSKNTDTNFPPYWFYMSAEGRDILHEILNAKNHIGVHVPVYPPKYLIERNQPIFTVPGESKAIR